MSDVTSMECPSGFIIKQNSDGYYVPFFVKVREEDIIPSIAFRDKIEDMLAASNTDYISSAPAGYVRFELDDWHCKVYSDMTIEMTKQIRINSDFKAKNNNTTIYSEQDLPVPIKVNDGISIQTSKSVIHNRLIQANINTTTVNESVPGSTTSQQIVNKVNISLYNSNTFDANFATSVEYNASIIHITIKGEIYYEVI